MRNSRLLVILIALVALASTSGSARAQDPGRASQDRYIEELKQRNADYGPGCNGIGISVPVTVDVPADMSSRWAAGHSACIPGLRLVMACAGDVTGDERVIACTLRVAEGQSDRTIGCDQITLITPGGRYTPDASLSDAMADASEGASISCSNVRALSSGVTMSIPFYAPENTSRGDLAVMIDLDGAEVPAFLVPAGQLTIEELPDS